MSQKKYTPQFVQAYQTSGTQLPIDTWYRVIGKKLNKFSNPSDVFLPVTLNVCLADRADGSATRINVTPTDSDWYPKLTDAVKSMCGIPSSTPVSIQTNMGLNIEQMSYDSLSHVGELFAIDTRSGRMLIHPDNKVVPPPKQMASDKLNDVQQWHKETLRDGVVKIVTEQLRGLDMSEVDSAMVRDGKVQKAIASFIQSSVDNWNEFTDTYARDERARQANASNNGQDAADAIARGFLQQIRSGMRANANHIRSLFAQKQAHELSGKRPEDNPLFSQQHIATSASRFVDENVMWREIVEDAMWTDQAARIPIACIYDGHERICTPPTAVAAKVGLKVSPIGSAIHPFKRIQAKSPLAAKQYPGNTNKAMAAYHMFTGRPMPSMPSPLIRLGDLLPVTEPITPKEKAAMDVVDAAKKKAQEAEKKVQEAKKKAQEAEERAQEASRKAQIAEYRAARLRGEEGREFLNAKLPELVPISSSAAVPSRKMPELVPISAAVPSRKMPELIPVSAGIPSRKMPELVPISAAVPSRKMPELVPISAAVPSRKMPELVECHGKGGDDYKKKKKPMQAQARLPELVPIAARSRGSGGSASRSRGGGNGGPRPANMANKKKYYPGEHPTNTRSGAMMVDDPLGFYDMDEPLFASGYDDAPNL